jgi:hypothetical protein
MDHAKTKNVRLYKMHSLTFLKPDFLQITLTGSPKIKISV